MVRIELDLPGVGPDSAPLPVPGQLSMDIYDLAGRYAAYMVESKRLSPVQQHSNELDILGEIRLDKGEPVEEIERKRKGALADFNSADRLTQAAFHRGLIEAIDTMLDARFTEASLLRASLSKEGEEDGTLTGDDSTEWNHVFKNSNRTERLSIVRDTEADNAGKLLARFDSYLMQWRQHLLDLGKSPEEVNSEIARLEDRFLAASPRGQVGISRDLRQNLDTVRTTQLSTLLGIWEGLSDPRRFHTEEDKLLPSRRDWQLIYDRARSTQEQKEVIEKISRKIEELFRARAMGEPLPLT